MVKKYIKWGFEAERQPLSGSLKGKHRSDIKVKIRGKYRYHEDKKRSEKVASPLYKRVEDQAIMYDGFCVLMNEDSYRELICGVRTPIYTCIEDKGVKSLHGFFEQDRADIVSVRQHGLSKSVFAITIKFWEELTSVK